MEPEVERVYPLILRTPTYKSWRAVLGIVLVPVAMYVLAPLLLTPVLAITVALDHHGTFHDAFADATGGQISDRKDLISWQALLYLNLTLALLTPLVWGIVRFVHGVRPRWLISVVAAVRWRFFGACFAVSLVAIGAQILVGLLLPNDPNDLGGAAHHVDGRMLALGAVVLLSTPLQAIGEEFVFRGYLTQAFGALTRSPWFAVLVSSTLFALAHGVQNAPLFLDRWAFGLMAGYIVVRTGGLEAGIALHIWNNLIAFGLALTVGSIDDSLKISTIAWSNIVLTLTQNGVYLVLVLCIARRMRITSRTSAPVLPLTTPSV